MEEKTNDFFRGFKGIWIPKEIWLTKELNFQEKLLLAEIDSLDNERGCIASNFYFSEFFKISERQISIYISNLKSKKYIYEGKFDGRIRTLRSNVKVSVDRIEENIKSAQKKTSKQTGRKLLPDRIVDNIENTISKKIIIEPTYNKNVNTLIVLFKDVNPNYEKLFSNSTQRKCLERLISRFGEKKTEEMIKYLPKIFGKTYAPVILTPYDLENKLPNLISYLQREKSKPLKGIVIR